MKDVNTLVICRDSYKSVEQWHDAVKTAVMLLLDADQILTVRYDEKGLGIVCIDFNPDNEEYGSDYPYWMSPTEFETVVSDEDMEYDE